MAATRGVRGIWLLAADDGVEGRKRPVVGKNECWTVESQVNPLDGRWLKKAIVSKSHWRSPKLGCVRIKQPCLVLFPQRNSRHPAATAHDLIQTLLPVHVINNANMQVGSTKPC